jgi:two-component system phosphate regulon sensor histidine kinase PhoR
MRSRRLLWQLFPYLAAVALVSIAAGCWYGFRVFSMEAVVRPPRIEMVAGGLLLLALIAAGSLGLAARLARPIEEMKSAADRLRAGRLDARMPIPDSAELAGLAEAINQLAEDLGGKVRLLEQQRNEQAAVLSSMAEGVIAVDEEQRIMSINSAAARLFGRPAVEVMDRSLPEVVRNSELQKLVARALEQPGAQESEFVLFNGAERSLHAHASALIGSDGRHLGALVVLHDVTRLRQLERVRRDFVANVSHELKTPITSIKGFVETLLDGALADPPAAQRFLEIIRRQAERLGAIIEDLLALSRIEQEAERNEIALQPSAIRPVLESAIRLCEAKAAAKGIRVQLDCDGETAAPINAPLLEQAIVNLLDNAIKYSEAGREVRLEARRAAGELGIRVSDQGCGIPAEHLGRIFERFYRVDKARSRQMGGTGLGLSIVKHIVQAHRGRVTVESEPGRGSTFTVLLP